MTSDTFLHITTGVTQINKTLARLATILDSAWLIEVGFPSAVQHSTHNLLDSQKHTLLLPSSLTDDPDAMVTARKNRAKDKSCDDAKVQHFQFPELRDCAANVQCQENQPTSKNMPTAKEASTAAAMQAVFQTSELVENILVHLPAKTIFGALRVSKSFRNAVQNSLPIKEKLFLRTRSTNVHKVIAHGFQHTAAALNPCFIQGPFPQNYAVHYMSLASRSGPQEKYGVTMEHDRVMSMESSVLDTYLLEVPCKRLKVSFRFWVGENSPTIGIFETAVNAGNPMTIRAMIDSVLESPQVISLAFDEDKWRGFKYDDEFPELAPPPPPPVAHHVHPYAPVVHDEYRYAPVGHRVYRWDIASGRWHADHDYSRKRSQPSQPSQVKKIKYILPRVCSNQIVPSLRAAKSAGKEAAWGCETYAKPSAVFQDLQSFFGPGSKIYVSLSQQPTFLLRDVVVPSPEEWAKIEARGK